MTTPKIDTQKRSFFQDRKMWFWIAAGSGLLTLIVLVIFLQSLISTTTYYVLNKDVPARQQITPDMLSEQVVSSGGQPPNALSPEALTMQPVYAKTSLKHGDILTPSNAGDLTPLRQGIPADYVVASFSADPNSSAGGNIQRGNYVDVFYVAEGQASLLFQRVMVLDTTTDLNSGAPAEAAADGSGTTAAGSTAAGTATSTDNNATSAYRGGVPFLYTVGMSQADALKLAATSGGKYYVVLSSANSVKDMKAALPPKTLGMSLQDVLAAPAADTGKGTNNDFSADVTTTQSTEPTTAPSSAPAENSAPAEGGN